MLPFGAHVDYVRFRDGEAVKDHGLMEKTLGGVLMGYELYPGGKWTGKYIVMDADTLETSDHVSQCM